jgi:hypothetical protein
MPIYLIEAQRGLHMVTHNNGYELAHDSSFLPPADFSRLSA